MAGQEGRAVQWAGYRILQEGIIYKAIGRDMKELMVAIGSNAQ